MPATNVSKVVMRGLSSTSYAWTGLHGVRFYDENLSMYQTGAMTYTSSTVASCSLFTVTASSTNDVVWGVGYAFDTTKPVNPTGSNNWWVANGDNQSLTISFASPIKIRQMTVNVTPSTARTDMGIDGTWYIDVYDNTNTIVKTYTVTTPSTTTRNTIQTVGMTDLVATIKYLVRDGGNISYKYDASRKPSNPWVVATNSATTESDFTANGMPSATITTVTEADWALLNSPKIISYSDANIPVSLVETSIPKPRTVLPLGDINMMDVDNIDNITFTINESGGGKVRVASSFDSGVTWKTWDGVQFIDMSITNIAIQGISKTTLATISPSSWSSQIVNNGTYNGSNKVRFAYYLEQQALTDVAEVDSLSMQLDMKGIWRKAKHTTDYDYYYTNTKLVVEIYTAGSYKVTKAN